MRIVQVGAYPPPYGGVTVHLMRLHDHLRKAGLDDTILDLSLIPKSVPGVVGVSWADAPAYLEGLPRSIVHFHNFAPGYAAVYARLARRHLAVLSLHNERFADELNELDPLRRTLATRRLRRIREIVVDNERCRGLAAGIWGRGSEIHVIPEFIPPVSVPPLTHPAALELRARCRYLLASNAWQLATHRGEDMYGVDLMIELMRGLVHERGVDAGLVLLLPGSGGAEELQPLHDRIAAADLGSRVVLITEPLEESSSLWREAAVVIRATNTDGSSLSVLEALAVGTPVVASDCVERPAGTVLFRNRSQDDLTDRVAGVLSDLASHRERVRKVAVTDNAAAFVALYTRLSEESERVDA